MISVEQLEKDATFAKLVAVLRAALEFELADQEDRGYGTDYHREILVLRKDGLFSLLLEFCL